MRLDIEGVLSDFPRDAGHIWRAPCKYVLVASEEVVELAFLFGVKTRSNLHGFGRVSGINLHSLCILDRFERAGRQGHGQIEQH
jgi:hypothetical protein